MDNDDEKRRVMTPPESWGGAEKPPPGDVNEDDSWLSDDTPIPGIDDPATDNPATAAADAESDIKAEQDFADDIGDADMVDEDGWLGAQPEDRNSDDPAASDDEIDPVESAMAVAATDPAPDNRASPTAAVSAAAAQLVDEELSQAPDTPKGKSAEALLTDHQQAEQANEGGKRPLAWIAALVTGTLLIAGGGWGVVQDRAALQGTIDQLKADLATAQQRSAGDLDAEEERVLVEENQALRTQMSGLREQYSALASELDQLQAMIDVAQTNPSLKPSPPPEPEPSVESDASESTVAGVEATNAAPVAAATGRAASPAAIPSGTGGDWFVNVASYSREDIAREWAQKLEKAVDTVSLQQVTVNGQALYRVRATGYADKTAAQTAAKALEQRYGIGPLWVGRDAEGDSGDGAASAKRQPSAAAAAPSAVAAAPDGANNTGAGGWFIYVDTYSRGIDADARAREIRDAGHDAKVAVESRQGELFYRVQVVGISSQSEGEATLKNLAQLGDLPNLQLRRY